jgi:hypothetical protein
MAITGSVGALYAPLLANYKDLTPRKADFFQTSAAGAATTTINILAKASAADEYYITHLSVYQTDATAAAVTTVYACTATVLGVFATGQIGTLSWNFGQPGLMCGNTDTFTAYIRQTGGTATTGFVCLGYKLI